MIRVEESKGIFFVCERDFQSLNSKGFGSKVSSSVFELDVFEVLFLIDKGKVEVFRGKRNLSFDNISKLKKVDIKDFIVYRDLKKKGYCVKSGLKYGFVFRVYDKGIKVGDDHALWLVEPMLEGLKLTVRDIAGKNRVAHSARKKMLFAIVDNEGDVTYLENTWKRL